MFLGTLICLLAIRPWAVLGQSPSPTLNGSATPTISVMVGATGHHFTPENVTANVGDIIEFRFYPLNHSVAKAEFMDPCIPSEYHEGKTGFWSGFHPLQAIPSNPPIFQIKINDTKPLFFYCSAPGACMDGMVGVVNQNSTQNLTIQKQYAAAAKIELSPGEPIPPETRITSTSALTSTSTSAPTTTIATVSATATSSPSLPGLSTGAIVGIAIGGAFVLICVCALVYLCGRQRTLGEIIQRQQNHTSVPPPYHLDPGPMGMLSPGYPPKNYIDSDPRHSNQPAFYQQREVGTESYRSTSPPMDESREVMITPMNLASVGGGRTPSGSGSGGRETMRRPVPTSPGSVRNGFPSAVAPMHQHQEESGEIPNPLRVSRVETQTGPHELSVESDRGYLPDTQRNE